MESNAAGDWSILDHQMKTFSAKLRDDVRIEGPASNNLASTIADECISLPPEVIEQIKEQDIVGLQNRFDELSAFQTFMDFIHDHEVNPAVIRAQVIVQNYVSFVYLPESCFSILRKQMPPSSTTGKCCRYLTNNPVRAFRNAIAHANWRYKVDFTGLEFWARKGDDRSGPMSQFDVNQGELEFWQALSRCIGNVVVTLLTESDNQAS